MLLRLQERNRETLAYWEGEARPGCRVTCISLAAAKPSAGVFGIQKRNRMRSVYFHWIGSLDEVDVRVGG
jgi:hypothetical protein